MKAKRVFILMMFVLHAGFLSAQKDRIGTVVFRAVYSHSQLQLSDRFYKLSSADSIQIELLKFYISGLELLNGDKTVWKEENSFHLIDASSGKSMSIALDGPSNIVYDKIKFNIGIDSLTNVSGALSGDLDPTLGMYWTWQSGYINFKLEGRSNRCNTRNNEFQFHLGGYLQPFETLQSVVLTIRQQKILEVDLDVEKFISEIDLANENHIMAPGKEAVSLSDKLPGIFSLHKR